MLFDFFNREKPPWAGRAIFADDEISCVSSAEAVVDAIAKKRNISVELTTIHIDGKKKPFEESSYERLKDAYKKKISASLTDEERETLAKSSGEWRDETDFQRFVAKLKESIPEKWQTTLSTPSLGAYQPQTDGKVDVKSKALQELGHSIETLSIEIRDGKITYETAKRILKPIIENVIEKSKEKGLMSSFGIQFSQTAASLKSFVDSQYSQNPTADFRGRLQAMESSRRDMSPSHQEIDIPPAAPAAPSKSL